MRNSPFFGLHCFSDHTTQPINGPCLGSARLRSSLPGRCRVTEEPTGPTARRRERRRAWPKASAVTLRWTLISGLARPAMRSGQLGRNHPPPLLHCDTTKLRFRPSAPKKRSLPAVLVKTRHPNTDQGARLTSSLCVCADFTVT